MVDSRLDDIVNGIRYSKEEYGQGKYADVEIGSCEGKILGR